MTVLSEIIRSEDKRIGAAQKASVVGAGAKFRSEQGSDYEPGVSAETVGSKVVFLGMVTLPARARTGAHVHERHETALYLLDGPGKRTECCRQPRGETRGLHGHAQRVDTRTLR